MKKTVVILLVLAVLLGGGYYWIGLRAESALQGQLAFIEAQYGPRFTLKHKDRGIFSSTYRYTVTYTLASGNTAGKPVSIDVLETVSHGPIPFASGSWKPALAVLDVTLLSGPDAPQGFNKLLEIVPELRQTRLRASIGFDGNSLFRLDVPAFKRSVTAADGAALALDWRGATATCDIGPQAASIEAALDAPQLSITRQDTLVTIQGVAMRSATKLDGKNLYLGKSALHVGSVQVKKGAAEVLSLGDLVLEGDCARREAVVDGGVALRGHGLAGKTGDTVRFDVALALKNLEFAALDELVGDWTRISVQPLPPEEQQRQLEDVLHRRAPALFSRGPILELNRCVLGVPAGTVESSARLAYVGTGPLPATFPAAAARFTAAARIATTQAALFDVVRLAGKANPTLDAGQARQQIEQGLAELIASGFVVRDQDKLSARADWDGKALTVNGKTILQLP